MVRNPYSYCFRLSVPRDINRVIGRTELRLSLRTGSLREAKSRGRILAAVFGQLFTRVRRMREEGLSEHTIKDLANKYRANAYRSFLDSELSIFGPHQLEAATPHEQATDGFLQENAEATRELQLQLYTDDYGDKCIESNVAEALRERGIKEIKKGSPDWKRLYREFLRAELRIFEMFKKCYLGDFSSIEELADLEKGKGDSSTLLNKVIENYWAENESAGNWADRTKNDYQTSTNLIKRILGNAPIHHIDYQVMRDFKETLSKLPAFLNAERYRGKSINEILKMKIEKRLSISTINKHLIFAIGLFNYAVSNKYIEKNPAVGLLIPQKKKGKRREAFSHDDLVKIFCSEEYINDRHNRPYKFWLPILGLFTGCRIEELCQLYIENVKEDDGIWFLDISEEVYENEEGGSVIRKVKTQQSNRLVPLHPVLVMLQFPEYVKSLKENGHERVFPELNKIQHRYSHHPSQWFSTFRKKCGITEKKKTFYSFRHTFITHLVLKQVGERMRHQVEGHLLNDITQEYTGTNIFTPKEIYNGVILKVDYGIDLYHLKRSKWCGKGK